MVYDEIQPVTDINTQSVDGEAVKGEAQQPKPADQSEQSAPENEDLPPDTTKQSKNQPNQGKYSYFVPTILLVILASVLIISIRRKNKN